MLLEEVGGHKESKKKQFQSMSLDPKLQMRNTTLADSLIYPSETLSKESSYDMLDF